MAVVITPQGTLNRLKASCIFPNFSGLNINSGNMGKGFVTVSFDGDFDNLLHTATGAVTSPEPYVMATVAVDLLRSQPLSGAWIAQAKSITDLGSMSVFPDVVTTAFPEIDLVNVILKHIDPGAFDGTNPVVRATFQGIYYVNTALWTV